MQPSGPSLKHPIGVAFLEAFQFQRLFGPRNIPVASNPALTLAKESKTRVVSIIFRLSHGSKHKLMS